jgi:hypothetical protein
MIDTWKKMFGPKDSKPDPLALANAKIAGLQERCGVYERRALDAEKAHAESQQALREADRAAHGADRTAAMYKKLYEGATKALAEIAAQETKTANATVKRMARMARAELPLLHHDANQTRSIGMAPHVPAH